MSTEIALLKMCPGAVAYAVPIENACIEFNILTALYKAYFLAICATETGGFTRFEENLNYGAAGLAATWPSRFNATTAKIYARRPREIANKVYADRLGNGPEASGDGWNYRGRGPIQCTGKTNYEVTSLDMFGDSRLVRMPNLLLDPIHGARAAGSFWRRNRVNDLIDEDSITNLLIESPDIKQVRRRVNGGEIGLDHFRRWLKLAKQALTIK